MDFRVSTGFKFWAVFSFMLILFLTSVSAQGPKNEAPKPWMNMSLSPDQRADMVLKEMTLDEKIAMLHGTGMIGLGPVSPLHTGFNGGAGYVVGVPRLGIPAIQMSDAAYGVRASGENGRYSTALPNNQASSRLPMDDWIF